MRIVKRLAQALGVLVLLFGLIQLVPYGRTHSNPATKVEPAWDSPRTRELAKRACFDCHSNETTWPPYSNVAPLSWVVMRDVENARDIVNFSRWDQKFALASYSGLSIRSGGMPPQQYRMAHPEADLTKAELEELARGLDATIEREALTQD